MLPSGAIPGVVAAPAAYDARVQWMLRRELDMAFRRRARLLLGWLGEPRGQRVLDCGCGRGFYLAMLEALGHGGAVGVDLEVAWLAKARARGGPAGAPPPRVASASLAGLPFPDASFDAVLVSEVLEHVPDDVAALREAARVLRPGGLALLSVPHADFPFAWDPLNRLLRPLGAHVARGPFAGIWAGHLRLYTPETLREVALAAGLVVEEQRSFVRRALPLVHFLLYGLGKPLVESRAFGRRLDRSVGRASFAAPDPGPLHPFTWVRRLVEWGDRGNRDDEPAGVPTVNLALRARKPA